MTLATFAPPVPPSPGGTHAPKIELRKAEFGDGYTQAAPKGLNHIRETISLKWGGLTLAQMQEIRTFFESKQGCVPFYYQPFGRSAPLKWTCSEWTVSSTAPWSMTAKLEQNFTLQV